MIDCAERVFYDQRALKIKANLVDLPELVPGHEFPYPLTTWVDAAYDCAAEWDTHLFLAPIRGRRIMQLGGMGTHAIKFLLAGAAESWLVSPVPGEIEYGKALGHKYGVGDRFHAVLGAAEQIPMSDGSVDAIYAGGCLHHMDVGPAMREIRRVLRPGGRFAAVEPWRTPLFRIGTAIFGKREVDVHCKPLTRKRMEHAYESFPDLRIIHHGTLTRYPLLALMKMHLPTSVKWAWRINRVDDALSSCVPGLRGLGSSVAVLAIKR
jgi:SAM-dependent methyltransferase